VKRTVEMMKEMSIDKELEVEFGGFIFFRNAILKKLG